MEAVKGNDKIFITSVYASPNPNLWRNLWESLEQCQLDDQWPWFIRGDFNATLFYHERRSKALHTTPLDKYFLSWMECMNLHDIGCTGPFFTWKREGCESRIDQVLGNNKAMEIFNEALVRHLPWFKSDHRPILLHMIPESKKTLRDRPFRFVASWALHEDFSRLTKEAWDPNASWQENVQVFTDEVKNWSLNVYGHLWKKRNRIMGRLEGIDKSMKKFASSSDLESLQ
ncbi:uncharacterized protein LOC114744358 [Neltuma alba]|uniref:uncharacterized protein LOC114744358 n=1 Tax=Neltuma alba TaxID=207710 RepID=UPI0010A35ABD|nr:uncharacterized protein LOC114744358 [Prosopis alba]